jgi:dTDP-4-amino-4,6-dideoxygalactose transaminase
MRQELTARQMGQVDRMAETIPFARPFIGKEEEEAVLAVLRSGWLTTGKETAAFEKDFGEFLQSRDGLDPIFCMAVNSATSGLHLAMEAAGIGKGDLVLVPSMTFTSTAEVARYLGAEAVFVDVLKDGYHMDPAALEATLDRLAKGKAPYPPRGAAGSSGFGPLGRAKALVPVHYGGLPCDMEAIAPIARKYGLKIIEDAAHSFPSFIPDKNDPAKGNWAGLLGDVGVFSFYATKTITTGEGGMVVTRDKAIADRVKIMRSHGIDRSVWNRYTDVKASWHYQVVEPGYKYNIPDILSALGRAQLRRSYDLLAMREKLSSLYDEAFRGDSHFLIPPTGSGDARHLYPLRLRPENLSITRDAFAEKLQERGVGISVHFIPLHTMPYYKNRYSLEDGDFPETLKTFSRTISLPLWPGMTEDQIDRVITIAKSLASDYTRQEEQR